MGDKWQNVDAGPRQVKDLQKAMGALNWEGKTYTEVTGVVGGDSHEFTLTSPLGIPRPEVVALGDEIKAKYGLQVTRENIRAIIADYEAALVKARESRPVQDNRRSAAEEAERAAAAAERAAEEKAREEARNAVLTAVMAKAPAGAKGIIYAEYQRDNSDPMTDYFNAVTEHTVAIGWRMSSREDFRALRAAAAAYPKTAHMADEDTLTAWQTERNGRAWGELEHRDNYSMGAGNYLSDHGGAHSGTGWIIKSAVFPCTYLHLNEDAIPDTPAPAPATAQRVTSTGGKVSAIGEDVLAILRTAQTDGPRLSIPARLSREDYVAVNRVLSAAGGSWSRRERAHVFAGDAGEILAGLIGSGTVEKPSDNGWFPTPEPVAALVIEAADLAPGLQVLEPSAGEGALAGPVAAAGCTVDCVEQDTGRALSIVNAGYARAVTVADFLNVVSNPVYDRVVMNPPFAKRADVAHVTHAARFLKPGGLLVAIMAAGVTYREDRATAELRALVDERGGCIEPLAGLSFHESGTDVNTVLVTLPAASASTEATGALFALPA